MVHDFAADLQKSEQDARLPLWDALYREFFGADMVAMHAAPLGSLAQRSGIDRMILLTSGKTINVDEKLRFTEAEDVLLEFDSGHGPGWVCKPTLADYILYAWAKRKAGLFLDVPTLQRAWSTYGKAWVRDYGVLEAHNEKWTSGNCAVPKDVLLNGMAVQMHVGFRIITAPQGAAHV